MVLGVRTRTSHAASVGRNDDELATAYLNRRDGDRADNIEQAIAAYQQAFKVMTHLNMPIGWARAMNNLGLAYFHRIHGVRVIT